MFQSALIFRISRRWQKRIPRSGSENSREITALAAPEKIFSRYFLVPYLFCTRGNASHSRRHQA